MSDANIICSVTNNQKGKRRKKMRKQKKIKKLLSVSITAWQ